MPRHSSTARTARAREAPPAGSREASPRSRRTGQVRRLPVPAPERQAVALEEVEELRDRIRPVARVEQRVGQGIGVLASRDPRSDRRQRVVLRQRLQRRDEIVDLPIRRPDPEPPAIVLEHVDAGPAVGRIHHQVHRAVGPQHGAQRAQARIGIREMVQHAGADDQIELALQLPTRSIGNCRSSRFVRPYCRFSCSV